MITYDKQGFPVIKRPEEMDLSTIVSPTKSGQGNPFHSSFTGKFTFAPPGVQILKGGNLIKGLATSTRKVLFDRAKISNANQLSAQVIDGNLHMVLLKDGRRVDSFAVPPRAQKGVKPDQKPPKEQAGSQFALSEHVRDAVVDAAREGLEGAELKKFLLERGINITGEALAEIEVAVDKQIQDDLVDYLHQQLRKQVNKEDQIDRIRIAVGRGFLRRIFSRLDDDQTRSVLLRLEGRGWSEDVIKSNVVSKMPKEMRDTFDVPFKALRGKKEVEAARKEKEKQATQTQSDSDSA